MFYDKFYDSMMFEDVRFIILKNNRLGCNDDVMAAKVKFQPKSFDSIFYCGDGTLTYVKL